MKTNWIQFIFEICNRWYHNKILNLEQHPGNYDTKDDEPGSETQMPSTGVSRLKAQNFTLFKGAFRRLKAQIIN